VTRSPDVGNGADSPEYQLRVDAHFDALAHAWRDLYMKRTVFAVIHQERRARALRWIESLDAHTASPVLEIGSGAGLLAVDLAARGFEVDCVDSSAKMVELTRGRVAEAGADGVTARVADAHELPFPAGSYGTAVALGVIPFLHSPSLALEQIHRVLKPGGYLVCNSDNLYRLNHLVDPRFTPPLRWLFDGARSGLHAMRLAGPPSGIPARRYAPSTFLQMVSRSGFETVETATLGFGPFGLMGRRMMPESIGVPLHQRLQARADRRAPILRSTGSQQLVLARRI
jgi:SAM-dependent methyltransferase